MRTKIEVRPIEGRAAGKLRFTRDWALTIDGREIQRFALKVFAVMRARAIGRQLAADGRDAELTIKNAKGIIVAKDSYGSDPLGHG